VAEHNFLQDKKTVECRFTNKERRQLQHEMKIHLEKYFKGLIGKAANYTKVVIWDDTVIIQGEGFLTEPEKFVARGTRGGNLVKQTRMQVAQQFAKDNVPYFEEKLGANCIHQTYDVEANKDFWIHVMIFDQLLIEFM
jgi:uncharacterized protein YbcI